MVTPNVKLIGTLPTAHAPAARRPCGHIRHVGSCPHCQQAQLARWAHQLEQVSARSG